MKRCVGAVLIAAIMGFVMQPVHAKADMVINELFLWSSHGLSQRFIELFGAADFDLTGYTLQAYDGNGGLVASLDLQGSTAHSGYFLIGSGPANQLDTLTSSLNSIGGTLILTQGAEEIDALSYGTGAWLRGEGTPAVVPDFGYSLSRNDLHLDTNDNNSDFIASSPTPQFGAPSVPVPSILMLLGSGLAVDLYCGLQTDLAKVY